MTQIAHLLSTMAFDWDTFEAENPKHNTNNTRIKRHSGDSSKIYCHAPYAQNLYELYTGKLNNLIEPKVGNIITGTVLSIGADYARIDINWREDAIIELRKENQELLKYIQPGFPIEISIEKIESSNKINSHNIIASYSKNLTKRKSNEIFDSIGSPVAYLAKIKELIHGGYFVEIDGVECFMPGSLAGMNKIINFESLLGKSLYVMPINFSKEKNYIVVSHRDYLKVLVPNAIDDLEIGKEYEGFVTGCIKHGIFVEFNDCLTGLISRTDISSENIDKFDNGKIAIGESIKFYVKEIIDNDRLVLSQKPTQNEYSAWDDIDTKYKVPSTVTGRVKRLVQYGAFIEIEPKIVGLLHKSNLTEGYELVVGQEIDVKITKIDKLAKKVNFTI